MTKTIFLLNIDDFAPDVTAITYPLIRYYAERIGAEIHTITERRFPEWPVTYEKMQIHELAKEIGSDWNIYIDSDTLIHPECPDWTLYLPKGTVGMFNSDLSTMRFKPDEYALRDGRFMAPGNWFMIASDLCLDLWQPLDITIEEAVSRIFPSAKEQAHGVTREHLIDDFTLARNIARYGLRVKTVMQLCKEQNLWEGFLQHQYLMTHEEQVAYYRGVIYQAENGWNVGKLYDKIIQEYPM
jgi:hypothetical protein